MGDAVAYYSFNSSNGSIVKDLVGSADGTLGNGASVGVGGKFGSNALIIGDDYQYFDIPNFSSPQITIMGWYYFGSTGGGEWNTIFCREGGYYHHLLINDSSKEVGFYNNAFYSSGVTLTPQTLYHFAVVKDGLVQKIYLNGELIMNSNNSFNNSTYPFGIIGNFNKGGNQGAMGWIDEVKIFNRVLSGEEILAEYNWTLSDVDSSYTTKLINTKKNTSLFDSVIVNPSGLKYGEEIDPNSESSLASGLVGLWHLNDKNSTGWLLNSATGVRDAVLSGDADVSGIGLWDSNAGSFNGTNYIYGSDSGFPSGASPRTITFWAFPILVDSSYNICFFYGTYSSNAMTEVGIAPNNNWFVSQHGNSVYGSAVAQNEWSFVTVVYDGSVWYFYVNGALVGSGVMSTNTILDQFNIGAERGGQTLFEGTIEEVAIWNRAFSESEVKDLFSKGASRMGVQARACSSEDCSTQWSEVKYGSNDYKYFSLPRSKYFQFKITSELIPFEAQQIIPESCVSTYGADYWESCYSYFMILLVVMLILIIMVLVIGTSMENVMGICGGIVIINMMNILVLLKMVVIGIILIVMGICGGIVTIIFMMNLVVILKMGVVGIIIILVVKGICGVIVIIITLMKLVVMQLVSVLGGVMVVIVKQSVIILIMILVSHTPKCVIGTSMESVLRQLIVLPKINLLVIIMGVVI